jgi:hypothetical protein
VARDAFQIAMTPELREFVRSAPPDSALGRARAFGIDVDALVVKMVTTTALERLSALDRRIEDLRLLRSFLE